MSRTSPGPPTEPQARARWLVRPDHWMVGPAADLGLILLTPLVFLLVFALARLQGGVGALTALALVLAMGHHLPGMMRAYGDRALSRRFRVRFVVAPLFLVGVSVLFAWFDLHGVMLLAAVWGAWHWMMQTYGFVRIYDAKAASFATTTARLDQAMCIAWFGWALVVGQEGLASWLTNLYHSGAPLLPGRWFVVLRQVWIAGTAVVSGLFLIHTYRMFRRGEPPNPLKLLLMAVTFTFYYYTVSLVSVPLVAYALFEGCHDIQYLTIVWHFNRNRAAKDAGVGGFTRFLFRRRGLLILLYVALCLAYGSYDYAARLFDEGVLMSVALSIITASSMLHFYYDGFIWKIREKSTRESLGVGQGGSQKAAAATGLPAWSRHGSKWLLFVVPAALLGVLEAAGSRHESVRIGQAVAKATPTSVRANATLCGQLVDSRRIEEALRYCRRALGLGPAWPDANFQSARALAEAGKIEQAIDQYRAALRADPDMVEARSNLAQTLRLTGRLDEAVRHFRAALATDGRSAPVHHNLGLALLARGQAEEAIMHLRRAVAIRHGHANTHHNLAAALRGRGDRDEAVRHYELAARFDPGLTVAHIGLGDALREQSDLSAATAAYEHALAIEPDHAAAHHGLAVVLFRLGSHEGAIEHFRAALRVVPEDAAVHMNLAAAFAATGRFDSAVHSAQTALELAEKAGHSQQAERIRDRLETYRKQLP